MSSGLHCLMSKAGTTAAGQRPREPAKPARAAWAGTGEATLFPAARRPLNAPSKFPAGLRRLLRTTQLAPAQDGHLHESYQLRP